VFLRDCTFVRKRLMLEAVQTDQDHNRTSYFRTECGETFFCVIPKGYEVPKKGGTNSQNDVLQGGVRGHDKKESQKNRTPPSYPPLAADVITKIFRFKWKIPFWRTVLDSVYYDFFSKKFATRRCLHIFVRNRRNYPRGTKYEVRL